MSSPNTGAGFGRFGAVLLSTSIGFALFYAFAEVSMPNEIDFLHWLLGFTGAWLGFWGWYLHQDAGG